MTNELLQKCESIKLDNVNLDTTSPSISRQLSESGESSSFYSKEGNSTKPSSIFDPLDNNESRFSESEETSMELDPAKEHESSSSCSSMEIQGSPDRRPGWLLLRTVLNQRMNWSNVKSKASVVRSLMRLPSRYYGSSPVHPDHRRAKSDVAVKSGFDDDDEAGAVAPLCPDTVFEGPPKELLSLLENRSSVCRLFSYKEVLLATSNFSPGWPSLTQSLSLSAFILLSSYMFAYITTESLLTCWK